MATLNDKGITALCEAIVLQAVQDYRKALRGKQIRPHIPVYKTIKDCEIFFKSDWCKMLTRVNGEYLMRKLQEEYRNESNSYPKYKSPNRNNL